MKIDQEKVKERLRGIPEANRSHIYDASIVLEFLTETFMPTRFFLPEGFNPQPGMALGSNSMRKVSEGKSMPMYDFYNAYLLWRETKDYTKKIESRYIFGIIIRNLRFYKNRWEFITWRVGVAQIWHVGPLVLRADVPAEVRSKFSMKVEDRTIEATTIEADPVNDPNEEDEPVVGFEEDRFVEVPEADRFVEVPDINSEPVSAEDY